MLNTEQSEKNLRNNLVCFARQYSHHKIQWRIPTDKEDEWARVSVDKVPTYYLICLLNKFEKKGYSKINGLVDNEAEWQLRYIEDLEKEFDKRKDVDEYL
jgi:hypothetical protein